MPHTLFDKVKRWALENDPRGPRLYEIFNLIEYHADKRFIEYHPTAGPFPDFRQRLRDWLNSIPDEDDQKLMLELVWHLFFVGTLEFNALYRAAYNGPVVRWLIDLLNLSISDPALNSELAAAVDETWFCPITDSMQIAAFYHINSIAGRNERPDWHSLGVFGDQNKVADYMVSEGIERIVLLEDFVGSGSQMLSAIRFASSLPGNPPILVLPLIVCPTGFRLGKRLARNSPWVAFEPVLVLEKRNFVARNPTPGEDHAFPLFRELASRLYGLVSGGAAPNDHVKPYGPFGFRKTGALTVMYSNTPDNTLPIVHHRSNTWSPLFPRSTRI